MPNQETNICDFFFNENAAKGERKSVTSFSVYFKMRSQTAAPPGMRWILSIALHSLMP